MEATSAWCAFEGRDIRQVLPLLLSSSSQAERPPLRRTGPRRPSRVPPASPQSLPLAHVRAPPKVQRQVLALPVPQALALSSRRRPPSLCPSSVTLSAYLCLYSAHWMYGTGLLPVRRDRLPLLPERFIVVSALCFCLSCCLLLV